MLVYRKKSIFSFFQFLFIFCTICFYSGAFTDHLIFGQGYGDDLSSLPKIINSLLKFPLYIFACWIIIKNFGLFNFSLLDSKFLLIFVFLCFVNSFFSSSVSDSIFKLFSLFMTFVVAHAFAVILLHDKSTNYLSLTLLLLMFFSVFYIFLLPEYGLMSASDDFEYSGLVGERQGVFKHKNVFGAVSAFSFLYAFYFLDKQDRLRSYLLFMSISCLFLANSATKIFAVIGIIFFVRFVYLIKSVLADKYHKMSIFFSLFFIITFVFISLGLVEELIGLAGRDLTFTGRTVIWAHAMEIAKDSLLTGYGLSSIWGSDLGYIAELPFYIPIHSHNSFIETLLTSGIIGVSLLILYIFACLGRFSDFMLVSKNANFFLAIFSLALIDSFFEFTLFRGNSILFLISMASMFYMRFTAINAKV